MVSMPQETHFVRITVRVHDDSMPLTADVPRFSSLWLGPITDPVVASELAKRWRTAFAHKSPEVSLHPEAPVDVAVTAVDDAFLDATDLVEAVLGAQAQKRARDLLGDPTAFHNDPAGAVAYLGEAFTDLVADTVASARAQKAQFAPTDRGDNPLDAQVDVQVDVQSDVDWRAIFLKYRHHVAMAEGIDFLNSGPVDAEAKFTAAEWEALNRACDEDDLARAEAERLGRV
jgi:hypothetical protein